MTSETNHPRDEDENSGGRIPPRQLMISFMLVAGGYVVSLVVLFFSFVLLVRLWYPEIEKLMVEPDTVRAVFETNPEAIFPRPLFFAMLVINGFAAFGLGWLVSRLAPFAKFPHAFFLAVLTFVSFFQQVVGSPQSARWMFLAFMIGMPIAILSGGRIASTRKKS